MPSQRPYPLLSACGLNCGLCPRFHTDGTSRCPGCGGPGFEAKRPPCGILRCNARHGVEYCFQCADYPCKKLQGATCVDSFITHQHMEKDFALAKEIGLEAYQAALNEKTAMLRLLLDHYNDGRRKSFFCLAVNLLSLQDVRQVLRQIEAQTRDDSSPKEKAAMAAGLFQAMAEARGVSLKLRKKGG